ncbi:MAG: winged helix-turn-helix transcriptional regulator [Chloroflexi bacterium]|nr:winged helix-turn-helix transcriptional regulator [Chloroflexota bacterium]
MYSRIRIGTRIVAIPNISELNLLHDRICQALGDPRRIQIMYALAESRRHVSAIAEALDMPQSTVSRHLALLRQRGLVTADREGPAVYYDLADPRMIDVLDTMRQILRDSFERLSSPLSDEL